MKFKELINKNDFLKDKFKNLDNYFKEMEIDGISNNSKNIKNNFFIIICVLDLLTSWSFRKYQHLSIP